jgi:hypothetical protein
MSLKTENSRRVAKSRPVRMDLKGSQIRPVPRFSCKRKNETDREFQPGSKFVRYRVNGVL